MRLDKTSLWHPPKCRSSHTQLNHPISVVTWYSRESEERREGESQANIVFIFFDAFKLIFKCYLMGSGAVDSSLVEL